MPGARDDESPLALSTAWHLPRGTEPQTIPRLTTAMGFEGIELSSLSPEATRLLRQALREEPLTVVSVHAPCPVPYDGAARLDDLASTDRRRRLAAIDYVKRTIDLAAEVGARAVVIHAGRVEVSIPQSTVVETMEERPDGSWQELLARGLAEREARARRHLDLTIRSLGILTAHLGNSSVRLAAETRYEYNDIPNLDEVAVLLDLFAPRGLVYWHDVGHAHAQAVLGLATHRDYLDRYRDHLLGFHIHDAVGTHDHRPPGEGEIDFAMIARYLRSTHLRVVELASHHPVSRVARGLATLRAKGW
ncbi:MAG: sugar phosphate isomerase/epimerase family protein [Armatimonadota bacterium]|nr:sugar phosphate isomerase/epimerase family protein [Armatimonadota bacterium]MDR7550421.1 sugar phosphate isomerase/epimerase family protein [Armatimonadota bacterium]